MLKHTLSAFFRHFIVSAAIAAPIASAAYAGSVLTLILDKTAGFRSRMGRVFTVSIGHLANRFDPLEGRTTEQQLYDSEFHLMAKPREKDLYCMYRATRMGQKAQVCEIVR